MYNYYPLLLFLNKKNNEIIFQINRIIKKNFLIENFEF